MLTPLSNAPFSIDMEKKIASTKVVTLFGLRAIVGTFDKHDPKSIYFDGTINIKGTSDKEALTLARDLIDDAMLAWLKSQDDYDRKRYVKIVERPESDRYVSKNTKLHFDLTLLQLQPRNWKETVEVVSKHLMTMYEDIVRAVLMSGLELKDFKGFNSKDYKADE